MALYNPANVQVNANVTLEKSNNILHYDVSASTQAVVLVAEQVSRIGLTIYNNSTANLFVYLGPQTHAQQGGFYSFIIYPAGYYEMPFGYTGEISGWWSSNTGLALINALIETN